jgi:hypothetical protein
MAHSRKYSGRVNPVRRRSREGDKESEMAKKIGLTLSGLAIGKDNR